MPARLQSTPWFPSHELTRSWLSVIARVNSLSRSQSQTDTLSQMASDLAKLRQQPGTLLSQHGPETIASISAQMNNPKLPQQQRFNPAETRGIIRTPRVPRIELHNQGYLGFADRLKSFHSNLGILLSLSSWR